MIPKIVHYCWLSSDPIPDELSRYIAGWKEKLPDYCFKKWDFSVFDKESSIWVKEAFDCKKYAFACDFIRLFAVYMEGGIYMDSDIEVLRAFDPLLTQSRMFASEGDDPLDIEAGCFGAEAGDPFLKQCLEYYDGRHFVKTDGSFDTTTLPVIMKNIIIQNNIDISTYGKDYFTCKSFQTGEISTSPNSFAIHHFAGSWLTVAERERNEKIRRLCKYMNPWVARNLVEYGEALRNGQFFALTKSKVLRKIHKESGTDTK